MRRRRQKGLTLIELIVAFTIMLILTGMAVPSVVFGIALSVAVIHG